MIQNILLILNIVILESLLSVDNAAVLATMVKDLPRDKQPKALRYGMFGAFVFRGLCLLIAAYLIKVMWLKIVGGIYLVYLCIGHFTPQRDTIEEGIDKGGSRVYKWWVKRVGAFWATIILVELMDLVFSLDNIFAAVAMSKNLLIIVIGVCIGIIIMRWIAQWFSALIYTYPSLEHSAFIVIGILGIKLMTEGIAHYFPSSRPDCWTMSEKAFNLLFSGIMMLIFFIPLLFARKKGHKS